ncbi:MAG: RES family NAD+ phosphorylase [Rhodobacteraceae bacterium]|nr:RES family NAD+ phosphorylase [Paracoccaceae bacterium]
MAIPGPPSPLTNPQIHVLPGGSDLHRVHRTTFRAAEFNPGRGGQTRFAPFADASGSPVPSLYASATLPAAIHETIFHDVPAHARTKTVRHDEVFIRTHSVLHTNRDVRLVELRNVTLGAWGISRKELITSSPALYGQTVLWAKAIHRDIPDADGLVWTSNQCDPDDVCLFFGDRVVENDFTAVRSRDGATDKSYLDDVMVEGRLRGITLTI